jgi:hypothetical protein
MAQSYWIGPNGRVSGDGPRHPDVDAKKLRRMRAARLVAPLIRRSL